MGYLIISTSLNPRSRSRTLARHASKSLEKMTGTLPEFLDLQETPLPFCDGGAAYGDENARYAKELISQADGVLLATAIYNYDANAAAKNLVEMTGDAWTSKVTGFLCAAGGQGSYMSIMGLANSLMLDFRSVIIPRFVYTDGRAFKDGALVDEHIHERLDGLCEDLMNFSRALNPVLGARAPDPTEPASQ